MLKVLVVEDEKLVRSQIVYNVTRCGLNFEWVMESESAEEAVALLEKECPDIIITDIMMGEMNGIELIKHINQFYPKIATIIICGHSDFEFAQKAVDLNVVSYLLKPVKISELTAALQKASLRILKETNVSVTKARNDLLEKKLEDKKLQLQLYSFLNGFHSEEGISLNTLFPADSNFFKIAVLHIEGGFVQENDCDENQHEQNELLRYGIKNIIDELGGERVFCFGDPNIEKQIIIIMSSNELTEEAAKKQFSRQLSQFSEKIVASLDVAPFFGISMPSNEISVMGYEQAKRATDLRLFYQAESMGKIFYFDDCEVQKNSISFDTKLYQSYLDSGDTHNAVKLVRAAFIGDNIAPSLNVRITCIEIICVLARCCFKNGVSVFGRLGSEMINGSFIDSFSSIDEIVSRLCDTISVATNEWSKSSETTSDILEHIRSYIKEHYANPDLCTNELSMKFCISLGYLSTSYKRVYNTTISKQIIKFRMEKAKELLLTTDLPLHIIAQNSGFNNLSYFMRVFKKHYNCTCSQLRESNS